EQLGMLGACGGGLVVGVELDRREPVESFERLRRLRREQLDQAGPHAIAQRRRLRDHRECVLVTDVTRFVTPQKKAAVIATNRRPARVNIATSGAKYSARLTERGDVIPRRK